MKKILTIAILGLASLVLTGCPLTTGQVVVNIDLGTVHVSSSDPVSIQNVNLNDNKDYVDHKANVKSISDYAVLGVVNNGSSPLNFEVWMTPGTTAYTSATDVKAHAIKLWGPLTLAAGASRNIGWDDSAGLFTAAGKAAVITETLGDGQFTLYALGLGTDGTTTSEFTATHGQLVLVIDAGI